MASFLQRNRKWFVLIGSMLLQATIGTIFLYGNFAPYIASYMAYTRLASSSFTTTSATEAAMADYYNEYLVSCNWIFTTAYIAFILSSLLGGHIQQQIGVKFTILLSSIFMSIGTLLCYFTITNLYALVFCSVIFGCGAGIAYPVSFVSCLYWFKDRNTRIQSDNYVLVVLLTICFTSSPVIFAPIQFAVINPEHIALNEQHGFVTQQHIIEQVPIWFIYQAVIMAVLQCLALLSVSNPSLKTGAVHPYFFSDSVVPPHSCRCNEPVKYIAYHSIYDVRYKTDNAQYQMRPIEILLNVKFWQLWMLHFLSMILYFFIILFHKLYAIQYLHIVDDHYLTVLVSVAFVWNGCARFLWHVIFQRMQSVKGKKIGLFVMNVLLCIFTASLSISDGMQMQAKMVVYAIWLMVIFGAVAAHWILYPPLVAMVFGRKYTGYVMGFCCIADIPALLIVGTLCGHLYSLNRAAWQGFTWIIAACLVFGVVLIVVFDPDKVIAERQLQDTMRSVQYPTYNSIPSPMANDTNEHSKQATAACQCGDNCQCTSCTHCAAKKQSKK